MATRVPGLIVALAVTLSPASVAAQGAGDSSAFVQVISGETLRAVGVVRLADLLRLADRWDVATVDGFTWQAAPAGLTPFQDARWLLLVDGQRIEADLFGITSLNRLPVPLEVISRVELVSVPQLQDGELATSGLIHIHTREPASGISAGGWATRGSEIGDPGPFAFTPLATPNVDRFGDDASLRVSYGGGRWFAEATARTGELFATDPAIGDRYTAAVGSQPVLKGRGQRVRLGARLGGALHEVTYQRSTSEAVFLLDPLEAELPTDDRFEQLGLTGTLRPSSGSDLRYYVTRAVNRSAARRALLPVDFAWKSTTSTAGIEAGLRRASLGWRAGLRMRRVGIDTPQPADPPGVTMASLYNEIAIAKADAGSPVLASQITLASAEIGVSAVLRQRWRLGLQTNLQTVLGYARAVHAQDNSIWAWRERGYGLLHELGAAVDVSSPPGRPQQLTADAAVETAVGPGVRLQIAGSWRGFDQLTVEQQALTFMPASRSFAGPVHVTGDASGQVAGAELTAVAQPLRPLRARLAYRILGAIQGDQAFRAAWATISRHLLRYTTEYEPVDALSFWMMVTYRGPSRWSDFTVVEAQSGGAYGATVPGAVVVDVGVQKWFWKQRLRLHLGFNNVLGSTLRYHPAGANWDPTVLAQAEARLP